jgi:hypothetical protein
MISIRKTLIVVALIGALGFVSVSLAQSTSAPPSRSVALLMAALLNIGQSASPTDTTATADSTDASTDGSDVTITQRPPPSPPGQSGVTRMLPPIAP